MSTFVNQLSFLFWFVPKLRKKAYTANNDCKNNSFSIFIHFFLGFAGNTLIEYKQTRLNEASFVVDLSVSFVLLLINNSAASAIENSNNNGAAIISSSKSGLRVVGLKIELYLFLSIIRFFQRFLLWFVWFSFFFPRPVQLFIYLVWWPVVIVRSMWLWMRIEDVKK